MIILPEGWTIEKAEMGYDHFWGDNDSDGQVAKAHGLKSPQPIMCEL